MALASIGKANSGSVVSRNATPPRGGESLQKVEEIHKNRTPKTPQKTAEQLFTSWSDIDSDHIDDDSDPTMVAVIEESLQEQEEKDLRAAIEASRLQHGMGAFQSEGAGPSRLRTDQEREEEEEGIEGEPFHLQFTPPKQDDDMARFSSLNFVKGAVQSSKQAAPYLEQTPFSSAVPTRNDGPVLSSGTSLDNNAQEDSSPHGLVDTSKFFSPPPSESPNVLPNEARTTSSPIVSVPISEPLTPDLSTSLPPTRIPLIPVISRSEDNVNGQEKRVHGSVDVEDEDGDEDMEEVDLGLGVASLPSDSVVDQSPERLGFKASEAEAASQATEEDEEFYEGWSRSPSPTGRHPFRIAVSAQVPENEIDVVAERDWDAAHEVDVEGEEGEFARFLSQVKGKDIETVRNEIELEIKELHKAKKNHQRDSEEITQQVIAQIMVRVSYRGLFVRN